MIVAIPFGNKDAHTAIELLDWMLDLGACRNYKALLAANAEVDWAISRQILKKAKTVFSDVHLISTSAPVEGWPVAPNQIFRAAIRFIQDEIKEPFLYLDPDAIPLKEGWLEAIDQAYQAGGKPFMGKLYRYEKQFTGPEDILSGIAVYPANACYLLDDCIKTRINTAWDVTASSIIVPQAHDTNLIHWLWGEPNNPPVFSETNVPGTNVFCLKQLKPEAVIFHRNQDGSLIRLLRKRMFPHKGVPKKTAGGPEIIVRRTAALGDVIASMVVADRLAEAGYSVTFEADSSCHCLLRRNPHINHIRPPGGFCNINLDNAYEGRRDRDRAHFGKIFIDTANQQFKQLKLASTNSTPQLFLEEGEETQILELIGHHPKPWVYICPRSYSAINRAVPVSIWAEVINGVPGTKFWLGNDSAPEGCVDPKIRHVDNLIRHLACANLLITTDTGPMHIAAAVGTPCVVIEQASSPRVHLTDQRDWISVAGNLECLNCQKNICPINSKAPPCQIIDPALIIEAANRKLKAFYVDEVSAVIAVLNPNVDRLNKCLEHVLPQVSEAVITIDGDGKIPVGVMDHHKIVFAQNWTGKRLGYGKNANLGCRHSSNRWILLLNDDVFLNSDAVERMREVANAQTAIVAQLLHYPDGTIQHGGTYRNAGDIGWGHIDHRARDHRIKEPMEMENVTLASALVRREAFYEVLGFDERFDCYCEDNDLCMKVRKAGWKIMYQPKADGIHEEHQTTERSIDRAKATRESCRLFAEKWGSYFKHNSHKIPGTFEYMT